MSEKHAIARLVGRVAIDERPRQRRLGAALFWMGWVVTVLGMALSAVAWSFLLAVFGGLAGVLTAALMRSFGSDEKPALARGSIEIAGRRLVFRRAGRRRTIPLTAIVQ